MDPITPRTAAAVLSALSLLLASPQAPASQPLSVTYLGNEAVMIEQGDTKVLFDPLFRLDHAYYQPVPDHLENAMVAGEPPFDGVDALMVSHYHLDHFSPNLVLNYLVLNPEVRLYAPEQAVQAIQQFAASQEQPFMERVTGLNLSHYGNPFSQKTAEYEVEILRIPHAGWPEQNQGVQNLVYRLTLADGTSVLHLGDAAAKPELFERFAEFWNARPNDLVLAPYWFLLDEAGKGILAGQLRAGKVMGIHVPAEVSPTPAARPAEYRDLDLLLSPGTKRMVPPLR